MSDKLDDVQLVELEQCVESLKMDIRNAIKGRIFDATHSFVKSWLKQNTCVQSVTIKYQMEYGDEGSTYPCADISINGYFDYYDDDDLIQELGDYLSDLSVFEYMHEISLGKMSFKNPDYKPNEEDDE